MDDKTSDEDIKTIEVIYNYPSAQAGKINKKKKTICLPKVNDLGNKIMVNNATKDFLANCGEQMRVHNLKHIFESPNHELIDIAEVFIKKLKRVYVSINPILPWPKP